MFVKMLHIFAMINFTLVLPVILYAGMSLQVDMTALKQMGENDLKELGIPMVIIFFI
jgi:hypothetical protein